MLIGGLLKFSLIDYPGKVAAVVFTQGCNYRCPFCHNPELVLPELFESSLAPQDVFSFLEKRRGQLQGVVVTGGEPTLHAGLGSFLERVKSMGFLIKLDTNGSSPEVLRGLLERGLLDFVAMDVKSSPQYYCKAIGVMSDIARPLASIELLKRSGVEHQFRTTALKPILGVEDAREIVQMLGSGERCLFRRGTLEGKILDYGFFADKPEYSEEEWSEIVSLYKEAQ
jgi:pyruvate formate lyase activating enzyme